ncbi:MAG: DUF3460 family protein [Burkholderiaceae bacterium]|nr:DUF3460 family protein [Burkholderiaceae bacterium]
MAEYESDLTRFLRELKQKKPDLERKQREAREIWWDKSLDLDEQARFAKAHVPMQGYVYGTKPKLSG